MSTAGQDAPVTLVTGGGSGIGAATVRLLLGRGHRVAITGRGEDRLKAFAAEAGAGDALLLFPGDASDPAAVGAAVDGTVGRFGRLDHVVANAGFSTHDDLANGDPEQWREMLLTNVLGPAVLIRAALPALRAAGGRIVLVGSTAGVKNTPGNFYSVTKFAVSALAENARVLVTGSGVGVTLVSPGRVESPFWDSRGSGGAPDGPIMTSENVAESIVWALAQPAGVEVNSVVLRPSGQVH
ncbi:SDR family oxidoreductase [Actinomadura violacea]|uniref:SDR family NAD(P)-dependent oxidoreductase n=1 Tax=Actinomadura violacea TaxID=2819934 RepID=A0ABS3RME1_9ACTN|nr:SDR family NAD(P)-dependent oxidoreductase [Actinomadura violacea]MBO2457239.1 SDR family NAD(P)-dependent oxidoreductase [Actinomadura violacea]